jgi:hypothetical protein
MNYRRFHGQGTEEELTTEFHGGNTEEHGEEEKEKREIK